MDNKDQLIIFDTTLRDGEQSPGASMNIEEKLEVARQLEALKVDVIEAGFPISSPGDFEAVKTIATHIRGATIAGLCRAVDKDIDAARDALASAERARIHTFLATSPIHMKYKLKMTEDEVIARVEAGVKRARNYCDDVEFSAEDAGRSDVDFLCRVIETAIRAGAHTINIPDTVGYTLPHEYGALIARLIEQVPNSDKAIFSCHCHNDLGLAVANSLAAVLNGGRQVECTINGIGERAGNASLEEVVMAVKTRSDVFPVETSIQTQQLVPTSKLLSKIIGFAVQPNKAIVGTNAFAHEAGIHQDGILKSRETYEIMRAEEVGWDSNKLVLGKHSGRNAFREHLSGLGIRFKSDEELELAFQAFKDEADEKHSLNDKALLQLMHQLRRNKKCQKN